MYCCGYIRTQCAPLMTILAIVPGISKVCLQENLVDCADCGGLAPAQYLGVFIKTFLYIYYGFYYHSNDYCDKPNI